MGIWLSWGLHFTLILSNHTNKHMNSKRIPRYYILGSNNLRVFVIAVFYRILSFICTYWHATLFTYYTLTAWILALLALVWIALIQSTVTVVSIQKARNYTSVIRKSCKVRMQVLTRYAFSELLYQESDSYFCKCDSRLWLIKRSSLI